MRRSSSAFFVLLVVNSSVKRTVKPILQASSSCRIHRVYDSFAVLFLQTYISAFKCNFAQFLGQLKSVMLLRWALVLVLAVSEE